MARLSAHKVAFFKSVNDSRLLDETGESENIYYTSTNLQKPIEIITAHFNIYITRMEA